MIDFTTNEDNEKVLYTSENHFIEKDEFIGKFGENFNYEELINHKNITPLWKKRFKKLFDKK